MGGVTLSAGQGQTTLRGSRAVRGRASLDGGVAATGPRP